MKERLPGSRPMCLGHLADGNLHFLVLYEAEAAGGDGQAHAISDAVIYEPLAPLSGSVSAEHGIGLEKKPHLHISRSPIEIEVMRGLKTLFDPKGTLNPGKIF